MQIVTFYINEKLYGVDIRLVKEVNPFPIISPVPLSREYIRGLVNIRGQVVLIMDVGILFGYKRNPVTDNSHIVILKTEQDMERIQDFESSFDPASMGDKPMGFLVDRIGDVMEIATERMEPAPQVDSRDDSKYVEGIVKLDREVLVILNIKKMIFIEY